MNLISIIIITLSIGAIIGGIYLLKKSAKKFDLSPEQLALIKKRNEALDKEERKEK